MSTLTALKQSDKNRFTTMLRTYSRILVAVLFFCFLASFAHAQWKPMNPVVGFKQQTDGVVFTMKIGVLRLLVCSDSVVRVTYSATPAIPDRPDYVVIKKSWP